MNNDPAEVPLIQRLTEKEAALCPATCSSAASAETATERIIEHARIFRIEEGLRGRAGDDGSQLFRRRFGHEPPELGAVRPIEVRQPRSTAPRSVRA